MHPNNSLLRLFLSLHHQHTVVFTSSTGSTDTTTRDSTTSLPSSPDASKQFFTATFSIFTSPKSSREKSCNYQPKDQRKLDIVMKCDSKHKINKSEKSKMTKNGSLMK